MKRVDNSYYKMEALLDAKRTLYRHCSDDELKALEILNTGRPTYSSEEVSKARKTVLSLHKELAAEEFMQRIALESTMQCIPIEEQKTAVSYALPKAPLEVTGQGGGPVAFTILSAIPEPDPLPDDLD